MKKKFHSFSLLLLYAALLSSTSAFGQDTASSPQPKTPEQIPVQATHGFFKCKYGKMEIIDAVARFGVQDEYSKTYGLGVSFCYKPMTSEDISMMKSMGIIDGPRTKTLRIEGFGDVSYPRLGFGLLEQTIGQVPPKSSETFKRISFTVDEHSNTHSISVPMSAISEDQTVHYEISQIDEKHFFGKRAHCRRIPF